MSKRIESGALIVPEGPALSGAQVCVPFSVHITWKYEEVFQGSIS